MSVIKYIFPLSLLSGIGHGMTTIATGWWLNSLKIPYKTIGLFTLVNAAYGFTILWISFFDRIDLKKLLSKIGIKFTQPIQRKGFIVISIFLAALGIFIASFANPAANLFLLAIPIAFAAFWMSTADSLMLAYVYETLQPKDMGASTAAYRLGIFISGSLLIFLYDNFSIPWSLIFKVMPMVILILMSVIFIAPKEKPHTIKTWEESFILPYKDIINTYKYSLITIVLFIAIYKMHDRFIAPMEQLFLFKQLGATKYFLLKLVSTFALSFSAIKSGPLIKKFKYKGAFIISVLAGISTIGCYYLCTLKTYNAYSIGILIASLLFGGFYYIVKKQKRYIAASVLLSLGMIFGLTRWVEIGIISTFATVIIAKMTSGIRSSVLYSYQTALCSKEYALTQVTLMTSIERLLLGFWVQGVSGYFVESFGWSTFYLITLGMSIMPLLLIQLTKYPKAQ